MSWRESLQIAQFKNLKFFVENATTTFGRRVNLHEYPKSDKTFAEDMGRMGNRFSFNAYLFGDNYLNELYRLKDILENDGTAGTLVHPTHGQHIVRPQECSLVYDDKAVGHEYLRLTFVEAGENKQPSSAVNTQTVVKKVINDFGFQNEIQYAKNVDLATPPDYAAKSIINMVNKYIEVIEDAITLGDRVPQNLDELVREINRYKKYLPSVIYDNLDFINDTHKLYKRIGALWGNLDSDTTFTALKRIFNTDTQFVFRPSFGTPYREIEAKNNSTLRASMRAFALSEMTLATANQEFDSSNKVFARQKELLGYYSIEIENAGLSLNEELRRGLILSRSAMINDTNAKGAQLPSETTVFINESQTAFNLSYELYADSFRAYEIIANNGIAHPLFIPPSINISVLTR